MARDALGPDLDGEAAGLLEELAIAIDVVGAARFTGAHVVLPTTEFFPERWTPNLESVERLADRMIAYAGLGLQIAVDPEPHAEDASCALTHRGTPVWFAAVEDGICVLAVDRFELDDQALVTSCIAHALGHAARAIAGRAEIATYRTAPEREGAPGALEERQVDLTAIILGFGILTTITSEMERRRQFSRGGRVGHEVRTIRFGMLDPIDATFFLAAQTLALGDRAPARARIEASLEAVQADAFRSASVLLGGPASATAIRARLGLGPPGTWPPRPPVAMPAPSPQVTSPIREGARPTTAPVAVVVADRGAAFALLGFFISLIPMLAIFKSAGNALVGLVPAGGAAIVGAILGSRVRAYTCAMCDRRTGSRSGHCDRCGGHIVAEVRDPAKRFRAIERYEEEQRRLNAKSGAPMADDD